jgi:hypothetical protein
MRQNTKKISSEVDDAGSELRSTRYRRLVFNSSTRPLYELGLSFSRIVAGAQARLQLRDSEELKRIVWNRGCYH